MQRIFVTGGTGFVGRSVIRALLAHGFLVRALVRTGSERDLKGFEAIERTPGDVMAPAALTPAVEDCAAIIHLVGIIRERRARGLAVARHVRREAQQRWYEVDPRPLNEIDVWLEPYRAFWSDRLTALERHLDEEDTR